MSKGYGKPRKLLVHMAVSRRGDFLNEHELYEIMRSRQLFNVQVDLKKELGKTLRGIQDTERVQLANMEAQKILFLQRSIKKARERMKITNVDKMLEDINRRQRERTRSDIYRYTDSEPQIVFEEPLSRETTRFNITAASKRNASTTRDGTEDVRSRPYTGIESSIPTIDYPPSRPFTQFTTTSTKSNRLPNLALSPRERAFELERSWVTEQCDNARNERLQKLREYRRVLEKRVRTFMM